MKKLFSSDNSYNISFLFQNPTNIISAVSTSTVSGENQDFRIFIYMITTNPPIFYLPLNFQSPSMLDCFLPFFVSMIRIPPQLNTNEHQKASNLGMQNMNSEIKSKKKKNLSFFFELMTNPILILAALVVLGSRCCYSSRC